MSHFGDLDDDVLVQLARWLSCDQVLKLRATDKRWHLVLKRPNSLLGCEEVEEKVLCWVRLPLQSYMWVRLLGSGCTKLTLDSEREIGEFPGLDEALARESLMRCSNLRELTLQACVIDLASLSRLLNGVVPRLRILNMGITELSTPPTQASVADLASACPTIEQIIFSRLSYKMLQDMPLSWFQPFTKLTHAVNELGRPISSAQEIAETLNACPRLTSLSLLAEGSLVFDVAQHLLKSFEQLHKLQLQDSILTKDCSIALMQACCNLTTLNVWNSTVEDGQVAEIICASPQLKELEVGSHESGFCDADVIAICNTQTSLVKLNMSNIEGLTDASVSAMQKLTSLVDLTLLYCLDYPLSGEALLELVQACPLLSTLTLERGASYQDEDAHEQNFQPSMLPGCSTLLAIRDLLEERGGALDDGEEED